VVSWCKGVSCGSRGEPLGDGVLLCSRQPGWCVGVRVARMILHPVFRGLFVCCTVIMVNRCHVDLVVLERLVELARRRLP
jgi:hypothetical protein